MSIHTLRQSLDSIHVPLLTGIEKFTSTTSDTLDLGTPNLGTNWQINFISALFPNFTVKNKAVAEEHINFTVRLLLNGSILVEERIEEINLPAEGAERAKVIPVRIALPQSPFIPGGSSLGLQYQLTNTIPGKLGLGTQAETGTGEVVMQYELIDLHKKVTPQRFISQGGR